MSERAASASIAFAAGLGAIAGASAASCGYTLPALIAGGLCVAAGVLRAAGW
ncbi:MAG: hypothetical protein ACOY3N_23485 [Bradyrhizobium sp.]|uniref:hypothetical protein n=1 Tax=Bradyrhizobium sp. TaxID=376 RepID=UPI003BF15E95